MHGESQMLAPLNEQERKGIAFVLWQWALRYAANTAKVGNLIFIAPFCSLLLIHFVLGEAIRGATLAGLVLIVAGLLYQRKTT